MQLAATKKVERGTHGSSGPALQGKGLSGAAGLKQEPHKGVDSDSALNSPSGKREGGMTEGAGRPNVKESAHLGKGT